MSLNYVASALDVAAGAKWGGDNSMGKVLFILIMCWGFSFFNQTPTLAYWSASNAQTHA